MTAAKHGSPAGTVRELRATDHEEWIRMRDALWPGSRADHETETRRFFEQPDKRLAVFVFERNPGRLGGFLEAGWRNLAAGCASSPVAYIEGWYVDPDLRGRGWGRALVEAAEVWARRRGFVEIASDCELDNTASRSAHLALGYEEVERAICFRKPLGG